MNSEYENDNEFLADYDNKMSEEEKQEYRNDYDENPPEKVYLLNCGHFGIKQFLNGEEFCQQCFDEYDRTCQSIMLPTEENNG